MGQNRFMCGLAQSAKDAMAIAKQSGTAFFQTPLVGRLDEKEEDNAVLN